ncbi:DnaD domain protein, partial [Streptococcus pneumoniae]
KEIDSAKDNSLAAIAEYYQSRVGVLDGKQFEQLLDYIRFDHMEYELVKLAIDKAADNSKRSFGYVNSILKNWVQNGIKTTVQQEEEQSNFNKSRGFTTSRGNQSEQGVKEEWGF